MFYFCCWLILDVVVFIVYSFLPIWFHWNSNVRRKWLPKTEKQKISNWMHIKAKLSEIILYTSAHSSSIWLNAKKIFRNCRSILNLKDEHKHIYDTHKWPVTTGSNSFELITCANGNVSVWHLKWMRVHGRQIRTPIKQNAINVWHIIKQQKLKFWGLKCCKNVGNWNEYYVPPRRASRLQVEHVEHGIKFLRYSDVKFSIKERNNNASNPIFQVEVHNWCSCKAVYHIIASSRYNYATPTMHIKLNHVHVQCHLLINRNDALFSAILFDTISEVRRMTNCMQLLLVSNLRRQSILYHDLINWKPLDWLHLSINRFSSTNWMYLILPDMIVHKVSFIWNNYLIAFIGINW